MAKRTERDNSLQELKRALKNKELGNLYFFYGEETFLLHHYLSEIKKRRIDPLTESFNFHRLNNENFDIRSFSDAVENLPMMAENTMVIVEDVDIFKFPEADRERLIDTLNDIPEYCTVIFVYISVPWKPDKKYRKLWDAVDTNGQIIDFVKQDSPELIAWVSRHFQAQGKRISNDLCLYLIEMTGGTMSALNSEIDKICAYSGADTIVKADIDAVVEPVLDAVVFQMTDMLSAGAYGKALQKLQQLLKMQHEPVVILGAIGGQYRRLGAARTLLDQGKGVPDLMSLCGMSSFPAGKLMDAAKRTGPVFCRSAMELVLETDYAIKTSLDDSERLLEMLILSLAREARNGYRS